MKADVLSQSNLKVSKVSRALGSLCEIFFIVSPLDHLYWAMSRDLKSILDQRTVTNMFYTTKNKQAVKSLNSPTLHLCSNFSKFSQHHCGLLILSDSDPSISFKCSDNNNNKCSALIINYLTYKRLTL